jgi:hypothetical protein
VGAAIVAAQGGLLDAASSAAMQAWGPGRLDVTTTTGTEPARIPDLRPVRWLTYLQQDATVRAPDLATLAIRLETLVITSNDQALRPPRIVMLALAAYVTSLAGDLPSVDAAASASPSGAELFASQCAGCHTPPGLTGDPVPLATVGTDPTLGLSPDRCSTTAPCPRSTRSSIRPAPRPRSQTGSTARAPCRVTSMGSTCPAPIAPRSSPTSRACEKRYAR